MNVLMIGGMSSLTNQLIHRIKKEGHRVYLLTGKRYNAAAYEKVFERYDLTYDSECLGDVFQSVNPDVTLFMGAYDSNFSWSDEERELVRITSGLINLLTAYTIAGRGRFIYLSSAAVYSESYEKDIAEDIPVSPAGWKGIALAQCEDICAGFRKNLGTDIVVLRVDHFYMIPKGPEDVNDICARMCLEAMKTGNISADSGRRFALLYESDAVEFIFRLIRCGEHRYPIYNLSASQELTETEIAGYIQYTMGGEDFITIEEKEGKDHRCILDNRRFSDEFGMKISADTQKTVEKVVQYMSAKKKVFLTGEQKSKEFQKRFVKNTGWLIKAIIPYLANLVCFLLICMLNGSAMESWFFQKLDIYLLYVLLFAVGYGQRQAAVSVALAVAGFCFTQLNDRALLDIVLDNGTWFWIARLFIVGLVVGYIKDQIHKLKMERKEEHQFISRLLADIKETGNSNNRVRDIPETEPENRNDSIEKIYRITSQLDQHMPEDVLFYTAEIIGEFLGSGDIAIYTVSNNVYARLFAFTSEQAKALGKSFRYQALGKVYNALAERKVYINRTLDPQYPMMANAIFADDQIKTIIMVWGLPWERMTLKQAELFTVVSHLIQDAVLRAARRLQQLESKCYQADGYVMEQEVFTPLVRAFLTARDKGLTECVFLQVVPPEREPAGQTDVPGEPAEPDRYEEVGKELMYKIRQGDYIGALEDGNLYILLTNSNSMDAEFVLERIESAGYHCILLEDFAI